MEQGFSDSWRGDRKVAAYICGIKEFVARHPFLCKVIIIIIIIIIIILV